MAHTLGNGSSDSGPRLSGLRYLTDDAIMSILINYSFHGTFFRVLVSAEPDRLPSDYDLETSIEGRFLVRLSDLSWGEPTDEKNKECEQLENELARLVGGACFSLMRKLAPSDVASETQTLEDHVYPPTHVLQVLTANGVLTSAMLKDYDVPNKHPPVPTEQLEKIGLDDDVLVVDASKLVLGSRLQNLVWKVEVNNETMICKVSLDVFGNTLGDELEVYNKLRRQAPELNVPKLKGVVKSHMGIIAILLGFIPHKHLSLRTILQDVQDGRIPEAEATKDRKKKWANQVKDTLGKLHELGILWRDVKTDNVPIDDNGDAVVLDFGGGNTVGWVDQDKYGTMKGEMQGLGKILEALGEKDE